MKISGFKDDKGWFLYKDLQGLSISINPQMEHIIKCYLKEEKPRETFKDGLIVNKIMDTVYKSAGSGKWENISS